jgi:hypothetical protein
VITERRAFDANRGDVTTSASPSISIASSVVVDSSSVIAGESLLLSARARDRR